MQIFFDTGAIFFFKKDGCGSMSFQNLRQLMVHFRELHANQPKVKCTYSRSTGTCEYRLNRIRSDPDLRPYPKIKFRISNNVLNQKNRNERLNEKIKFVSIW